MEEIQTIYINPLLRRLIAERYSKHFKIGAKRALGIVLAFIDPRMDSTSSYNKRGVWMDRVAIEAPRLLISRIQRQPGMIEKAGGERPTPAVVYDILLEAMDEYNNILKTEISHRNVTYFRRHLDGRIEFITGKDTFKMALLCSVSPKDFERVFRKVLISLASEDIRKGTLLSMGSPMHPVIKEKDTYGTVVTPHELCLYRALIDKDEALG